MKYYFAFINDKKQGPYSLRELEKLHINSDTLIWTKGLDNWKKVSEISECDKMLINIPPSIPNSTNDSFYTYIKSKYIYYILTIILSIIMIDYIDKYFFDYMKGINYGGYDSLNSNAGYKRGNNEIQNIKIILIVIVLLVGIFFVPSLYLFKRKKKT